MMSLPRRTHVSTTEKIIGGFILLLLSMIAVWVLLKGRSYDPSMFLVDESTLKSTSSPVENKASTLREESADTGYPDEGKQEDYDFGGYESQTSGSDLRVTSGSKDSVLDSLASFPGFDSMGDTEYYSPDTLYVKINGRAPAYIGFNFQELFCRTLRIADQPKQYLDVFIYVMDTPINAFGIFSLEREVGADPLDFVSQGYRSEMGVFFQQGNAYVQVIASDISESVIQAAERFSRTLASLIPVDDSGIGAAAMLPSTHQIPGSLSYIQEYAYGLEQLRDVFEARYEVDGLVFPCFGMQADHPSIEAAFAGVKTYFTDYGTVLEQYEVNGASVIIGESFEQYSVVFLKGDAIGGVMNADGLEIPKQFVETLLTPQP